MSSSPPLVVADRYRLIAPLGQGGMGRVWRATDVVLHREVAIKELVPPPGLTPGERQEMRERSLREARAIARLNNVNVVRVFDVLSTDADPWIVMEFVDSRSLQDILAQDGPFNALRTAEIGLGVLNALRAAHRNGVVHRDVKPGNVLIGADGRVVLTDFGLATVPGDPNVTRTGLVLGSPAYIAPERARDGTAGPAADLWSLGATLYAAVEGQSPFARPSAIATLAALATENVPVARNAGPLKPVLNGLLRKDPAHRINAEEAERLLARATGRRSKITFPMSPTMRRPGVGRERPSLPSGPGGPPVLPGSGWSAATGSAPVVPNPRPPAVGQSPLPDGRQPHYAPGKAQVAGPKPPAPPETPRRTPKPLDATRLDTPPVKDEFTPSSGTGQAPPTAPRGDRNRGTAPPGPAAADVPPIVAGSAAPTSAMRTGFTAADVAANRRRKAAPEHERSLAQATSGYPVVTPRNTPAQPEPVEAQATSVMPPASARPKQGEAQATTVMPASTAESRPAGSPASQASQSQDSPAEAAQATSVMPPTAAEPQASPALAAAGQPQSGKATDEPDSAGAAVSESVSDTPGRETAEPSKAAGDAPESSGAREAGTPETGAPATGAPATGAPATGAPATGASETGASETGASETGAPETGTEGPESAEPATVAPEAAAPETGTSETGAPEAGNGEAVDGQALPATATTGDPEADAAQTKAQAEAQAEADAEAAAQAEAEAEKPGTAEPGPSTTEEKTSVVTLPAQPTRAKTPPSEDMTSLLRPPPGDRTSGDRTTLLAAGADDDRTSVVSVPPRRRRTIQVPGPDPRGPGELGTEPGFTRPSRPAWTPMQMRPVDRPSGGITILGTTLTRRQAAIGLGIVLTFLLLVGIIVVQALGNDDPGDPDAPNAGVSAPAQPNGQGGVKPDGGKKSEAPPAKPTTPSAPASSAPAAGGAIPAGWRIHRGAGFSLPVPENARADGDGTATTLDWGSGRQIRIDIVPGKADPVQYLNDDSSAGGSGEIGPTRVEFNGPAADLEYLRSTGGGYKQHVVRRVFNVGNKTYVLTWYTEVNDWDAAKKDLEAIYQGFSAK